jgi:hypothetical protein
MKVITDYEEAEDYLYGMEIVVEEHPVSQGRWSTQFEQVVKDTEGDFWLLAWESGSTEYQEVDFELVVTQVYPKEVTKTIYTTSKD